MSALGQKRTLDCRLLMSALPPKADIAGRQSDVRFVPKADIGCLIRLPRRRGQEAITGCQFPVPWQF
jgi:hypothetical protein